MTDKKNYLKLPRKDTPYGGAATDSVIADRLDTFSTEYHEYYQKSPGSVPAIPEKFTSSLQEAADRLTWTSHRLAIYERVLELEDLNEGELVLILKKLAGSIDHEERMFGMSRPAQTREDFIKTLPIPRVMLQFPGWDYPDVGAFNRDLYDRMYGALQELCEEKDLPVSYMFNLLEETVKQVTLVLQQDPIIFSGRYQDIWFVMGPESYFPEELKQRVDCTNVKWAMFSHDWSWWKAGIGDSDIPSPPFTTGKSKCFEFTVESILEETMWGIHRRLKKDLQSKQSNGETGCLGYLDVLMLSVKAGLDNYLKDNHGFFGIKTLIFTYGPFESLSPTLQKAVEGKYNGWVIHSSGSVIEDSLHAIKICIC